MVEDGRRLLDLEPGRLISLCGRSLLRSIAASEGRTVIAETVVTVPPLVDGCSNPELAASFGADLVLLNFYDVEKPQIAGFPSLSGVPSKKELSSYGLVGLEKIMGWGRKAEDVKRMIGRPVGINLEPVATHRSLREVSSGRRATPENASRAVEQGVDFIVVTGNPGTGVTMEAVISSTQRIRKSLGDDLILMAGKMHGAGVRRRTGPWMTETEIRALAEAGVDVLLLPQPGTVPGVSLDDVRRGVAHAHQFGLLTLLTIGTSQEGSSVSVVERIALDGKAAGGDMFHIGDAGFSGIAPPELLLSYSIAIRGKRHTYRRIGQSLLRGGSE